MQIPVLKLPSRLTIWETVALSLNQGALVQMATNSSNVAICADELYLTIKESPSRTQQVND